MAILNRFLCWNLRTAVYVGLIIVSVTVIFALLLRLLDLGAIGTSFEISQGFKTPWRSHQWQAFLSSDVVLVICHISILLYSIYMLCMVTTRHFVMYRPVIKTYMYVFCGYVFIEFCFSVFEFSFYGPNTFRLAFVVFLWLYWVAKTLMYIVFIIVTYARCEEMDDEMAMELRFSDKKYSHSYA